MRYRIITLLALTAILAALNIGMANAAKIVQAADTISAPEAFLRIPQQDMELLPLSVRHDLYDYMQADSVAHLRNIFMGESWIEKMTPGYMKIHLSNASDIQIKILPRPKALPIVITVYTVSTDSLTADSTVKFYDNDMNELQSRNFIKLPSPKDFYDIPPQSRLSLQNLLEIMPFYTIAYETSADTDVLSGRITCSEALTEEQRKIVDPYLRKTIRWNWNGKRYTLATP